MMAPFAGPLVAAGAASAMRDVRGTTLMSAAPFVPPKFRISTLEQLPHCGVNVSGIEVVSRSPNAPYPNNVVNSVQLSRTVSISRCSYSFPANITVSLASDTLCCGQF